MAKKAKDPCRDEFRVIAEYAYGAVDAGEAEGLDGVVDLINAEWPNAFTREDIVTGIKEYNVWKYGKDVEKIIKPTSMLTKEVNVEKGLMNKLEAIERWMATGEKEPPREIMRIINSTIVAIREKIDALKNSPEVRVQGYLDRAEEIWTRVYKKDTSRLAPEPKARPETPETRAAKAELDAAHKALRELRAKAAEPGKIEELKRDIAAQEAALAKGQGVAPEPKVQGPKTQLEALRKELAGMEGQRKQIGRLEAEIARMEQGLPKPEKPDVPKKSPAAAVRELRLKLQGMTMEQQLAELKRMNAEHSWPESAKKERAELAAELKGMAKAIKREKALASALKGVERAKDRAERIRSGDMTAMPQKRANEFADDREIAAATIKKLEAERHLRKVIEHAGMTKPERYAKGTAALLRTTKTVWDMSFLGRQGRKSLFSGAADAFINPLLGKRPDFRRLANVAGGFVEAGRAMMSPEAALKAEKEIMADAVTLDLAKAAKLKLVFADSTQREDVFEGVDLLKQLPGKAGRLLGKFGAGSERAFNTYMNRVRLGEFKMIADSMGEAELTPETYRNIAQFVNAKTGAADFAWVNRNADTMNQFLFSIRYQLSGLQHNLMSANAAARSLAAAAERGGRKLAGKAAKETVEADRLQRALAADYAKTMMGYALVLSAAKGAAGLLTGEEQKWDPRTPEGHQIQTPGKRVTDFSGGATGWIRLGREIADEENTGRERFGKIAQFAKNKASPLVATALTAATRETRAGDKLFQGTSDLPRTGAVLAYEALAPIPVEQIVDGFRDNGIGREDALELITNFFGGSSYIAKGRAGAGDAELRKMGIKLPSEVGG